MRSIDIILVSMTVNNSNNNCNRHNNIRSSCIKLKLVPEPKMVTVMVAIFGKLVILVLVMVLINRLLKNVYIYICRYKHQKDIKDGNNYYDKYIIGPFCKNYGNDDNKQTNSHKNIYNKNKPD